MTAALSLLLLAPLPFALFWAAASDLQRFIIPNRAAALCALGALPALLFSGLATEAMVLHLITGAAAFGLGFALFTIGVWGGGDGKLFAAAALWFQPWACISMMLYVTLIGAALGVAALVMQYYNARLAPAYGLPSVTPGKWATHAPYGLAIAGGALLAFPETALYAAYFG